MGSHSEKALPWLENDQLPPRDLEISWSSWPDFESG
jgi:hypothetical protein